MTCGSRLCGFILVDQPCACRKLRPCRLSSLAILVDDSAESVLPIYGEAFDLSGFDRLRPDQQECHAKA